MTNLFICVFLSVNKSDSFLCVSQSEKNGRKKASDVDKSFSRFELNSFFPFPFTLPTISSLSRRNHEKYYPRRPLRLPTIHGPLIVRWEFSNYTQDNLKTPTAPCTDSQSYAPETSIDIYINTFNHNEMLMCCIFSNFFFACFLSSIEPNKPNKI